MTPHWGRRRRGEGPGSGRFRLRGGGAGGGEGGGAAGRPRTPREGRPEGRRARAGERPRAGLREGLRGGRAGWGFPPSGTQRRGPGHEGRRQSGPGAELSRGAGAGPAWAVAVTADPDPRNPRWERRRLLGEGCARPRASPPPRSVDRRPLSASCSSPASFRYCFQSFSPVSGALSSSWVRCPSDRET